MGILLALHLGVVLGLFLSLPYGKFVHGLYRFLALVKYASERRSGVIVEDGARGRGRRSLPGGAPAGRCPRGRRGPDARRDGPPASIPSPRGRAWRSVAFPAQGEREERARAEQVSTAPKSR